LAATPTSLLRTLCERPWFLHREVSWQDTRPKTSVIRPTTTERCRPSRVTCSRRSWIAYHGCRRPPVWHWKQIFRPCRTVEHPKQVPHDKPLTMWSLGSGFNAARGSGKRRPQQKSAHAQRAEAKRGLQRLTCLNAQDDLHQRRPLVILSCDKLIVGLELTHTRRLQHLQFSAPALCGVQCQVRAPVIPCLHQELHHFALACCPEERSGLTSSRGRPAMRSSSLGGVRRPLRSVLGVRWSPSSTWKLSVFSAGTFPRSRLWHPRAILLLAGRSVAKLRSRKDGSINCVAVSELGTQQVR